MKLLLPIFLILTILDVVSTYTAGIAGGTEMNPLVNIILAKGGYILYSIVKLLSFIVIAFFLTKIANIKHDTINFNRATIIAFSIFNVFMLYVVVNNFYIAFANW